MTQRYTGNDARLSKYILERTKNNKPLPYMTVIAEETGVSVATISRYAKRRGFYSFAEMRASFNKELEKAAFNDHGFVTWLEKASAFNVVVITSQFTATLGHLINTRLKELKVSVRIVDIHDNIDQELAKIKKEDYIIAISLSGQSARVNKTFDKLKNNHTYFITTMPIKRVVPKTFKVASLTDFMYTQDDKFEGHKTVRELFNWIDDCLNIFHIKRKS